jgi:hypothetical protein
MVSERKLYSFFPSFISTSKWYRGDLLGYNIIHAIASRSQVLFYIHYLICPVAALPLPLGTPLAMPLALGIPPPRDPAVPLPLVVRLGAGVENFDEGLELAGGFSTKEVSVVLKINRQLVPFPQTPHKATPSSLKRRD